MFRGSVFAMAAGAFGFCCITGIASEEVAKVGGKIPELSAPSDSGGAVSLSSYKGHSGVILFFFPKAFTPGCTSESCGFRDQTGAYVKQGYAVLGVSRDTPERLKAFKEKYGLNYPLLSDPDGKLALALGVAPGKRQTAIIARDGTLEKVIKSVEAKTHPATLLQDLDTKK